MSPIAQIPAGTTEVKKVRRENTFSRVFRYIAVRLLTLFITVVIGIYLTIVIANMGGYVDEIIRGDIRDKVTQALINNPTFKQMDVETRKNMLEERIALEEERQGLNTPVTIRNFRYLSNALTLNLG